MRGVSPIGTDATCLGTGLHGAWSIRMRRGCARSLTQRHRRDFDASYTNACGFSCGELAHAILPSAPHFTDQPHPTRKCVQESQLPQKGTTYPASSTPKVMGSCQKGPPTSLKTVTTMQRDTALRDPSTRRRHSTRSPFLTWSQPSS